MINVNWQKLNSLILSIFIVSCFCGSGISYGNIYLFHVCLIPAVVTSTVSFIKHKVWLKFSFVFSVSLLLLIVLSSIINHQYSHLPYYLIGFLIVFIMLSNVQVIGVYRKLIKRLLAICLSADLIIGIGEVFHIWRYPISKYSQLNHVFGRISFDPNSFECGDIVYATSSPTGFHWNENDFGVVICLCAIILFWVKKPLLKWGLYVIGLCLVVSTASKIGFYAYLIFSSILFLYELFQRKAWLVLGLIPLLYILTDGFYYFPTQQKKIKEIAFVSQSTFQDLVLPAHCFEKLSSKETRKSLTLLGVDLLKNKPLLGYGSGGYSSEIHKKNSAADSKKHQLIENPHNFLLEIAIDYGLIFILAIGAGLIYVVNQLYQKKQFRLIFLIFTSLITFIPISAMSSSLMYFLPFYLFLSLGLILIQQKLDAVET